MAPALGHDAAGSSKTQGTRRAANGRAVRSTAPLASRVDYEKHEARKAHNEKRKKTIFSSCLQTSSDSLPTLKSVLAL